MESQLREPSPCMVCGNETHEFYTNEKQEDVPCCPNCCTIDDDQNSADVDAQWGDRG
jgi:hypothetical protein